MSALTPTMKQHFVRRMRRMSGLLKNRGVVEEVILGDQGPFQNLADLESSDIAALLRHMAAPFPQATLMTLRRIIDSASIDELRAGEKSRRDVVWALEQLLWLEETFEPSARLLLKLAIAENETWSNNATGLWIETFQTLLGRTAAPPTARARVIQAAAVSTDAVGRKLAADAISAALKVEHVHRGGMPPTDVEGVPEGEWQPATYGEWADALLTYLKLLNPLLRDSDSRVRASAINALATGVPAVVQFAYALFDLWIEEASTFLDGDYSEREVILQSIRRLNERLRLELNRPAVDGEETAAKQSERREFVEKCLRKLEITEKKLLGNEFSSQFRWVLFQTNRYAGIAAEEQAEIDAAQELETLTRQAIVKPDLLNTEWEWLLQQKDWGRIVNWIELLGSLDTERVFEKVIQDEAATSAIATMYLSLYYLAHARATDNSAFIDNRLKNLITSEARPEQIFDLAYRAGYTAERHDLMCRMLESGSIPALYISQLTYGPWGSNIPPEHALELVTAAKSKADTPDAVIPFVSGYLYQVKDAVPIFKDVALELLLAPREKEIGQDPLFNWSRLAVTYVEQAPVEIAAAALEQISAYGVHREDELIRVVERAWEIADKQTLFRDVIADWLTKTDPGGGAWNVRKALEKLPIEQLGVEFLVEWVGVDPARRAAALADVIGAPVGQATELHGALLEHFGAHGVGSSFYGSHVSGSWVGSFADWTRGKLETARQWLDDKNPAMRDWAKSVVQSLEKEVEVRESREEEERFRF
jgi:hypothetical protein